MNLIFDFDGTLVDSFSKVIEKFNVVADEFNFRKIPPHEVETIKNLNSRELIKYMGIPFYKIPRVLRHARKAMNAEMSTLIPFLNLPEILQQLHDKKYFLSILTSNSAENVILWLKLNNIHHLFNFIHTESSYFGKARLIKKLLKKHNINKSQAFYIGDETRDIDAAKKSGIYSVAVTWGFNSEKTLLHHQPDFVARKPEDLLVICGQSDPAPATYTSPAQQIT
ncbi:MAG TPA: HAD hydrolase-like protein [Gammaproteobacteria bacterium]|nr:HAD hydrolase-like protein [Gammaproteobacteria bacterium]